MTTLRTAAQQALEALEDARTFTGAWPTGSKAITNLRAALAQKDEPVQEPITRLFGTLPVHDTQQAEPEGSVCARCGALAFDPLVAQQDEPVLVQGELPPRYVARSPIQAEPVEPVAHRVVAGVLFDFMGWLTSRRERLVLSSTDDAAPAADAIKDFAEMRGLSLNDAKVQDWNADPPQRQEPVAWNWMLDGLPYGRACYGDPPDADLAERAATAGRTVRLLYTAPPQRLLLTEEEIESCRQKGYAHAGLSAPFDFGKAARAVERAVWEKNHG